MSPPTFPFCDQHDDLLDYVVFGIFGIVISRDIPVFSNIYCFKTYTGIM